MKLLPHQKNAHAIRNLVCAGLDLLAANEFGVMVERYGYATALGRDLVDAVRDDLLQALSGGSASELLRVGSNDLDVVFFTDNSSCLLAAIDHEMLTEAGKKVMVSFVVTGTETEQFLTLEDICGARHLD